MGAACVHYCPFCVKRAVVKHVLLPHSYPDLYKIPEEAKQAYRIVSIYDVLERAVEIEGNRASAVDALFAGTLLSSEIRAQLQKERKFAEHADDFLDHLIISPAELSKHALNRIVKMENKPCSVLGEVTAKAPTSDGHEAMDLNKKGIVESSAETSELKEVFGRDSHGLLRFGMPAFDCPGFVDQSVNLASKLNQMSSGLVDELLGQFPPGTTISCAIITRQAHIIPLTTSDAKLNAPFVGTAAESFIDVPAPVFMRTGVFAQGQEIFVPALHNELVFELQNDNGTLLTQIKWLMQMYGKEEVFSEFFPIGTSWYPAFIGTKRRLLARGTDCYPILKLCIELGPAMKKFAADSGWACGGFWRYGVCNDSVELVVRAALGRSASVWPLLNNPQALRTFAEHVDEVFMDTKLDPQQIRSLKEALCSMPTDAVGEYEPQTAARIVDSWPWRPGHEPFSSAIVAYKALVTRHAQASDQEQASSDVWKIPPQPVEALSHLATAKEPDDSPPRMGLPHKEDVTNVPLPPGCIDTK